MYIELSTSWQKQLIEKRIMHLSKNLFHENSNFNNIHIAYVLHGFPIHSETFVVNEIKWLKKNGYNVTVFIKDEPYKPIKIDFDVDILKFNNIQELEELLIEYGIDLIHTHFQTMLKYLKSYVESMLPNYQ